MRYRRSLDPVRADLNEKMVLLSGPRQCGKTTLAKSLISENKGAYYNWDDDLDRKGLLHGNIDPSADLWILDEVHKNRRWRNWLKGLYDSHHDSKKILVTGSARLELFVKGGDSLQGRYFSHRMMPVTLSELNEREKFDPRGLFACDRTGKNMDDLLALGGFPEPLFKGSMRDADRWRLLYGTRLVRDEVSSLEQIQQLDRMELLYDRLGSCVGSVLSINSLREDIEVSFGTARKWIMAFERLYGIFRVFPFGPPRVKAVKKEGKLYFYDWSRVESEAARLENMIACHLLRLCFWMEDVEGQRCELRFFRTRVGHEVDFVVLKKGQPWFAVEVKTGDEPVEGGMRYLLERVKFPRAFQVHLKGLKDYETPPVGGCKVRVVPCSKFLMSLP